MKRDKGQENLLNQFFQGELGLDETLPVVEKPKKPSTALTDQEILDSLSMKLPYNSSWAIKLIKYCRKGNSLEAFCGEYQISPSQIQKWARENPEFEEAMRSARASEIWFWEKQLNDLMDPPINGINSETDAEIDKELMKICKFKLENLGYGSKLAESSKVIFKDQGNQNEKQLARFADTRKDAIATSEEQLSRMVEALYGSQQTVVSTDNDWDGL